MTNITDPATGELAYHLTAHPACALFPTATEEELAALTDDVRTNGQIHPVWIYQGDVLDGRNRLIACHRAGINPHTKVYEGDDPIGFALSLNLHRRHLTTGQKAVLALKVLPLYEEQGAERKSELNWTNRSEMHVADLPHAYERAPLARDYAAQVVGVSGRAVAQAKRVAEQAPELLPQVEIGALALDAADRQIKERKLREQLGKRRMNDSELAAIADTLGDEGDLDELAATAIAQNFESKAIPRITKPDLGGGISHPARYSNALLPVFATALDGHTLVLDPFAGTGKIHELQDAGHSTVGIEIEPEWAALHPDTIVGNALNLPFDDAHFDAICTSPTYGNRLADSHNAQDDSIRRSYTHDLGRPLNESNSGSLHWGEQYRAFHADAWHEACRVLRPGGRFVLNIKNHIRDGREQHVSEWHLTHLVSVENLTLEEIHTVAVPSLRAGSNADARVTSEYVFVLKKDA